MITYKVLKRVKIASIPLDRKPGEFISHAEFSGAPGLRARLVKNGSIEVVTSGSTQSIPRKRRGRPRKAVKDGNQKLQNASIDG